MKIKCLIIILLLVSSCSKDDDKKPCDDGYWVTYFPSCESSQSAFDVIYVSVDEGNRLINELNNTQENCVAINGVGLSGDSFSGAYIKEFIGELGLFDCSEECIGCIYIG